MAKNVRRNVGDVVSVPLGDGTIGFGRVLKGALFAFYDLRDSEVPSLEKIVSSKIAFKVWVMNYAVTSGDWPVLGNVPLEPELVIEPLFFKKDSITKALRTYRDSTQEEVSATREECEMLERASVWNPEHVVERLNAHFAGRRSIWVEHQRP